MEKTEELEAKIIEVLKINFERTGGANGTHIGEVDKILNLPIDERNEFLDRMVKEKKIIFIYPLNGRTLSLPK